MVTNMIILARTGGGKTGNLTEEQLERIRTGLTMDAATGIGMAIGVQYLIMVRLPINLPVMYFAGLTVMVPEVTLHPVVMLLCNW
ncbi:hypothetical protein ES703_06200 [subsurface metagenome]